LKERGIDLAFTVAGVLTAAAMLGVFAMVVRVSQIEERVDALSKRLDEKVDVLGKRLDDKISQLEKSIDRLDRSIEAFHRRTTLAGDRLATGKLVEVDGDDVLIEEDKLRTRFHILKETEIKVDNAAATLKELKGLIGKHTEVLYDPARPQEAKRVFVFSKIQPPQRYTLLRIP
jgi:prefoldin subunit 5